MTSPSEAREFAAETTRAAMAAVRLAIDAAPIEHDTPISRNQSYRLYRAMALEEAMGWVAKYASHIHIAPSGVKDRLRKEMQELAYHLNRILYNLDEADAREQHNAKPD